MADKCPICFSDIGTPTAGNFIWTDDPILTNPAPSVGVIVYEDYKGFTQLKAQHIKELQDNRKQIESDLGITPLTEFSVIDVDNLFQNIETYIYELRNSTEKILNFVGMTKDDYFNYDKDGNDMRPGNHQVDWTDIPFPVYKLSQFQSKAQHIEDLRHWIQITGWYEDWSVTPVGFYNDYIVPGKFQQWYLNGYVEIYDSTRLRTPQYTLIRIRLDTPNINKTISHSSKIISDSSVNVQYFGTSESEQIPSYYNYVRLRILTTVSPFAFYLSYITNFTSDVPVNPPYGVTLGYRIFTTASIYDSVKSVLGQTVADNIQFIQYISFGTECKSIDTGSYTHQLFDITSDWGTLRLT